MAVDVDARGEETSALLALADFTGKRVLEIGAGDGRLTLRYAHRPQRVTAIEPFRPAFERAVAALPADLTDRVTLRHAGFEDLAASIPSASFDLVLLSWTL